MPADEYSAAVSGGLKLKGVNPSSKVSKKKKKRSKPETDPSATDTSKDEATTQTQHANLGADPAERAITKTHEGGDPSKKRDEEAKPPPQTGKTEAELRHEERRRKGVYSLPNSLHNLCLALGSFANIFPPA